MTSSIFEPMSVSTSPRSRTVSVLVPCHNYGSFLGEALASLDAQTRTPDEILVCDDASTDDSWDVIVAETDRRPNARAIRNVENLGAIGTFNRLVRESTGDVVMLLSADDRYGPRYVEGTVGAMETHSLDFAYTAHEIFGADSGRFEPPTFDDVVLLRNNYIAGTSPFTRELFETVGGFDPAFERCGLEDWAFWMAATEAGFVGERADIGEFWWRRHEGGSRNTVSLKQRLLLRWRLLSRRPRFHVHPRSARYVGRVLTGGRTNVG